MGIFKASNDLREIFYYLKSDKTLFIEVDSDGNTTFQVLNHATPKSRLDNSEWDFEPISNVEFEDVLGHVRGLVNLGESRIKGSNKRAQEDLDLLGR